MTLLTWRHQKPRDFPVRSNSHMSWLAETFVVFLLSGTLIGAVMCVAALVAASFAVPVDMEQLATLFVEKWRVYLRPEPVERQTFLAGVAATFPLVVWLIRVWRNPGCNRSWISLACSILAGVALGIVFAERNFLNMMFHGIAPSTQHGGPSWISAFAACLLLVCNVRFPDRLQSRRRKVFTTATLVAILVYVTLFLALIRLRSPAALFGDLHFEAVYYAISQVMAGKTVLADLPSQYGLYAEIISPLLFLIGSDTLTVFIVFSILQYICYISLIFTVFLIIKSNIVRILCCFSLLFFVGSNWIFVSGSLHQYEYFQIWPIRLIFPSLMLFGFVSARFSGLSYFNVSLLAILAGVGIAWNLDWGIPAWGALVAVAIVRMLFGSGSEWRKSMKLLAIISIVPIAVVGWFGAYLTIKSGGAIDWAVATKYQRIFFLSGFGMLPLPRGPHPWMAAVGIYLYGIVYSIRLHASAKASSHSDIVLYLSVLGIGIFAYYQGRSHDIVLSFVVWPAVLIAFVLADCTLRSIRSRRLHWLIGAATVPILAFGFSATHAMISGAPLLWQQTSKIVSDLYSNDDVMLHTNVEFIRERTGHDKEAVIIAPGQAMLFGETGIASSVGGPGIVELLLVEDRNNLLKQLIASPIPHVFIEEISPGVIPEFYSAIFENYSIVAASGAGLIYLRPK